MRFKNRTVLFVVLFMGLMLSFSQNLQAKTPDARLFHFERSKNANYVCYDINQNGGKLDLDEPINVYWIRMTEQGQRKDLSMIERKMAYGYKVVKKGTNEVTIRLTAYDKVPIRIYKKGSTWVARAVINGQDLFINKMYAQLRSPNSLHVNYVDIYGTTADGKSVRERIQN